MFCGRKTICLFLQYPDLFWRQSIDKKGAMCSNKQLLFVTSAHAFSHFDSQISQILMIQPIFRFFYKYKLTRITFVKQQIIGKEF